jgi:hypothetical protein
LIKNVSYCECKREERGNGDADGGFVYMFFFIRYIGYSQFLWRLGWGRGLRELGAGNIKGELGMVNVFMWVGY